VTDERSRTSSEPRRTQQQRRADTEQRLLDAALRLIAHSGSRGTSVAQVSAEAGFSRGIITHQFGSKDELLRRAALYAQHLVGDVPTTAAGLEWVLGLVDNYRTVGEKGEPATAAFLILWSEAVAGEPGLKDLYIERDDWFRRQIVSAVIDGISDGSIRADVDPHAYAYILVGQLRGIGMQLMLSDDTGLQGSIKSECLNGVRHHLASTPFT